MSVTRRGAGCGGFVCGRRPRTRHRFKPRHAEAVCPETAVEPSTGGVGADL
jgi:hypothetical protein